MAEEEIEQKIDEGEIEAGKKTDASALSSNQAEEEAKNPNEKDAKVLGGKVPEEQQTGKKARDAVEAADVVEQQQH